MSKIKLKTYKEVLRDVCATLIQLKSLLMKELGRYALVKNYLLKRCDSLLYESLRF